MLFRSDHRFSLFALLLSICFVISFRSTHIEKNELSWDVFGYYLWLPATFIYDDPGLQDRAWVEQVNEKYQATGTLYQISTNDEGEPIYFFLMGMAIFYAPFFFIGHGIAWMTGAPMDGFSDPYQYSLVAGGIFYTVVGLCLFQKVLKNFLPDRIAAIVLLIVVFATNFAHHQTLKNLETVNILFTLMCWLLLSTIRWHRDHKPVQLIQIGAAITLMALVKPSEVLAVFIPALWGITNRESATQKLKLILRHRKQFAFAIGICLLIGLPQILYWHWRTGHFLYDSYKNPGVGLDFASPHIWDVLFSFRKGWLIYTPIMIFALIGFRHLLKQRRDIALAFTFYFCIAFYLIASWTEWWYGAAFSCRPAITLYPILGVTMGFFIQHLYQKSKPFFAGFVVFSTLALLLNQFQWWQLRNWILDPYRTTPAYYKAVFLKSGVPPGLDKLKLIERNFSGEPTWNNKQRYTRVRTATVTGQPLTTIEFLDGIKIPYGKLTQTDHLWITVDSDITLKDSTFSYGPFIVVTMLHKGEPYGYYTLDLSTSGTLKQHQFQYLTPPIRSESDEFSCSVWNPSKKAVQVKEIKVNFFEKTAP